MEHDWWGPLVVFPLGMDSKVLRDLARYFQCAAIKLAARESPPATFKHTVIDLRRRTALPKVWFRGVETTRTASSLVKEGAKVAPLFLEKYVDVARHMPVAIPCDLESAARLLKEGVKMVEEEKVTEILANKVPIKNKGDIIDAVAFDNLSTIAEIIPKIDWGHPYAAAVFHYCVMELAEEGRDWRIRSNYSPCRQVFNGKGFWGHEA